MNLLLLAFAPICIIILYIYYQDKYEGKELPNSNKFTDRLLRLPMFYELDVKHVVSKLLAYG